MPGSRPSCVCPGMGASQLIAIKPRKHRETQTSAYTLVAYGETPNGQGHVYLHSWGAGGRGERGGGLLGGAGVTWRPLGCCLVGTEGSMWTELLKASLRARSQQEPVTSAARASSWCPCPLAQCHPAQRRGKTWQGHQVLSQPGWLRTALPLPSAQRLARQHLKTPDV